MNQKPAKTRKSTTLHVRVATAVARRWKAEAKRRGDETTSDFVRGCVDMVISASKLDAGIEAKVDAKPPSVVAQRSASGPGTDGVAGLAEALEAAKNAQGDTLLMLVSPRQAERLFLALKTADAMVSEQPWPEDFDIDEMKARYAELSR